VDIVEYDDDGDENLVLELCDKFLHVELILDEIKDDLHEHDDGEYDKRGEWLEEYIDEVWWDGEFGFSEEAVHIESGLSRWFNLFFGSETWRE
jgi:hypothetical protein